MSPVGFLSIITSHLAVFISAYLPRVGGGGAGSGRRAGSGRALQGNQSHGWKSPSTTASLFIGNELNRLADFPLAAAPDTRGLRSMGPLLKGHGWATVRLFLCRWFRFDMSWMMFWCFSLSLTAACGCLQLTQHVALSLLRTNRCFS